MKQVHLTSDGEIMISSSQNFVEVKMSIRSLETNEITDLKSIEVTDNEYKELSKKRLPKEKKQKLLDVIISRETMTTKNMTTNEDRINR